MNQRGIEVKGHFIRHTHTEPTAQPWPLKCGVKRLKKMSHNF